MVRQINKNINNLLCKMYSKTPAEKCSIFDLVFC